MNFASTGNLMFSSSDEEDIGMDAGSSGSSSRRPRMQSKKEILLELIPAVSELQFCGLHHAAQWAAELAASMGAANVSLASVGAPVKHLLNCNIQDYNVITEATTHFQLKQYLRCATVLASVPDLHDVSAGAFFLRFYSLYLHGEKRREEEEMEALDPINSARVINRELQKIFDTLTPLYREKRLDGLGLYLYGVVLKGMELKNDARRVMVESFCAFPWNWSCCLDMISLYDHYDDLPNMGRGEIHLSDHWMASLFEAALNMEYNKDEESISIYKELQDTFPNSTYIAAQLGVCWHNLREYKRSVAYFEDVQKHDEYKIDCMESYSNILYVREDFVALSQLARHASRIDKFTPTTAYIIGNYFSLRGEHEKAVTYFRRAIALNRNFASAWILTGHEFMELKNTPLAIDFYRTAVSINPRDYRAWYGLGQAYELLDLHFFALEYYKVVIRLREKDTRMWHAIGSCYEKLDYKLDAVKSYERALMLHDHESLITPKLAKLHAKLGNTKQAAAYYEKIIDTRESSAEDIHAPAGLTSDVVDALKFLMDYYFSVKEYDRCKDCAQRLQFAGGPERNSAKTTLREIADLTRRRM